jgi:hypothetical protein
MIGIKEFILKCIEKCEHDQCPFFLHSLIILEHISTNKSVSTQNSISSDDCGGRLEKTMDNFFDKNSILRVIAVERPKNSSQLYVAEQLGAKYHFSCPTSEVSRLFKIIKKLNNVDLEILFIPRTCEKYQSKTLHVFNQLMQNEMCLLATEKDFETSKKSTSNNKRNETSLSMGLQTMYSHQQHTSRYSMLAHSRPHMTTIKEYPISLRQQILKAYLTICKVLASSDSWKNQHPFCSNNGTAQFNELWYNRMNLRKELQDRLFLDDIPSEKYDLPLNNMFEACTIQQTGALRFHRDVMNCPSMDWTLALHVPNHTRDEICCWSYLYYSRKCVGDYVSRMGALSSFLVDESTCNLTKLSLRSILETKGIFNYQGALFENKLSLNKLAMHYESQEKHSCPEITVFTGLSCFKHGAAFDKMGYYSIFINVLLSFHYLGIVTDIDDSISMCIYFGLLCNGTSNLAAAWTDIHKHLDFAFQWCHEHNDSTRLLNLLVYLEKERRRKDKTSKIMYGCCKMPRFQYANYTSNILEDADMVHCYVKDFLGQKEGNEVKLREKDILGQHSELFKSLSHIKGIGPLSFNQFWHALCLSGVLPIKYFHCSAVAPNSGPAKLIQTFYPNCNSAQSCLKKLHEVKNKISGFGMKKITDFVLENMFCEMWRLGNKSLIATKTMDTKLREGAFMSEEFHEAMINSHPTKNPDLYFKNPFNESYQHLFRVGTDELLMRPSFLDNSDTSSTTVRCNIVYAEEDGTIDVSWTGEFVRQSKDTPCHWFV